mgnify:CR=1 FL=1
MNDSLPSWTATANTSDGEILTVTFDWAGSAAEVKREAARQLLEQWSPGRILPSAPRASDSVQKLAAYGVEIVSVEPAD